MDGWVFCNLKNNDVAAEKLCECGMLAQTGTTPHVSFIGSVYRTLVAIGCFELLS